MIHRDHIENFLRLNGIATTAPEKEIRDALRNAKWHDKDVDMAILVLRGGEEIIPIQLSPVHRLLHTDSAIAPETLSALLGVDVKLRDGDLPERHLHSEGKGSHASIWIAIAILSILLAFVLGMAMMYVLNTGPFFVPITQL